MSTAVETFLARLYVEPELRARFLAEPQATARAAGLAEADCAALAHIDRDGLTIASRSFAAKRGTARPQSWLARISRRWLGRNLDEQVTRAETDPVRGEP